jgi:hypothetical protein
MGKGRPEGVTVMEGIQADGRRYFHGGVIVHAWA